jgi:hypothetical protein
MSAGLGTRIAMRRIAECLPGYALTAFSSR